MVTNSGLGLPGGIQVPSASSGKGENEHSEAELSEGERTE